MGSLSLSSLLTIPEIWDGLDLRRTLLTMTATSWKTVRTGMLTFAGQRAKMSPIRWKHVDPVLGSNSVVQRLICEEVPSRYTFKLVCLQTMPWHSAIGEQDENEQSQRRPTMGTLRQHPHRTLRGFDHGVSDSLVDRIFSKIKERPKSNPLYSNCRFKFRYLQ